MNTNRTRYLKIYNFRITGLKPVVFTDYSSKLEN